MAHTGHAYQVLLSDVFVYLGIIFFTYLVFRHFWRRFTSRQMLPTAGKAVLITGCDTGFGKAAALKLAQDGYTVFAGCLNAETANLPRGEKNLRLLQMDITNENEVNQCVKVVEQYLAENPQLNSLAAVVANAGIARGGYVEFLSIDSFQNMVKINLLGTIRIFKAFLPLVRLGNNKTGGGRLIAMSSMSAHVAAPGMSGYCATKAGLLAFMDCLRFEVEKRFGISVSIILPDLYCTEIVSNVEQSRQVFEQMLSQVEPGTFEAYGGEPYAAKVRASIEKMPSLAKTDLSPVINAICHAVGSRRPKRRYYPISAPMRILSVLIFVCPTLAEWLIGKIEQN